MKQASKQSIIHSLNEASKQSINWPNEHEAIRFLLKYILLFSARVHLVSTGHNWIWPGPWRAYLERRLDDFPHYNSGRAGWALQSDGILYHAERAEVWRDV